MKGCLVGRRKCRLRFSEWFGHDISMCDTHLAIYSSEHEIVYLYSLFSLLKILRLTVHASIVEGFLAESGQR